MRNRKTEYIIEQYKHGRWIKITKTNRQVEAYYLLDKISKECKARLIASDDIGKRVIKIIDKHRTLKLVV